MSTPEQPHRQFNFEMDSVKLSEFQLTVPKLLEQAKDCELKAPEDFVTSGVLLDRVVDRQKLITEFFEQPAKQAYGLHKFVTSLRAHLLEPLLQAEELLKDRRRDWRAEQEKQRLALEQQQRKIAKEEEDARAMHEAAQLQAIGETEAAETVLERAANAPPPPVMVASNVPKEKGHSFRTVYEYRVVNSALIKREFLTWDNKKIQPIVDRLGPDAVAIVGGIEVYSQEQEIVRRKK